MPEEAIGVGFHEAVRGVLSHHLVIRDGKIANYHPYPPTPWNASPRDHYGTPGPYEDAVQGMPDLRGERPGELQGHRHHAHGPQLRPVSAVRRAHVPRRRHAPCRRATRPPSARWRKGRRECPGTTSEARDHVARTEELLSGLEGLPDTRGPRARDGRTCTRWRSCTANVSRGCMHHRGPGGHGCASPSDELVGHLLLVHDLHPDPVEQRVRRALEDVRGATVLEVREPQARVAVSAQGCGGPSEEQLTQTVRDAVAWAAPEIEKVEIERAETSETTLISVDSLFRGPQPAGNR